MSDETQKASAFAIYRGQNAMPYSETSCMEPAGLTDVILEGAGRFLAEGADDGQQVKLLFSMPGMSLTYAWFKSGFPLPLHSHNADCLYYIIAGSIKLGTENLGAGNGFYVGSDVPYTYTPGDEGVEILEFRTADKFDIRFLGKSKTYWDKLVASVGKERGNWSEQKRPTGTGAM